MIWWIYWSLWVEESGGAYCSVHREIFISPWYSALFPMQKITLLRVIPTMTFNSSHLTIYLAYLTGIPSGMSSDVLSGIYIF